MMCLYLHLLGVDSSGQSDKPFDSVLLCYNGKNDSRLLNIGIGCGNNLNGLMEEVTFKSQEKI